MQSVLAGKDLRFFAGENGKYLTQTNNQRRCRARNDIYFYFITQQSHKSCFCFNIFRNFRKDFLFWFFSAIISNDKMNPYSIKDVSIKMKNKAVKLRTRG